MRKITEPAREIPVIFEKDVIVSGGGPGGLVAAIAASRMGADTILIEQQGFLGGTATAGLMNSFNGYRNQNPPNDLQTVKGIAEEIVHELIRHGGAAEINGPMPYKVAFDPEILKYVALKMCKEAGVQLLLYTYAVDVIVEDDTIKGVIVENKSGRQAILSRIVIDATGDGDTAAAAGAPFEKVNKVGENMMGMSLLFRVGNVKDGGSVEQPGVCYHRVSVDGYDGADGQDLTDAHVKTHEMMIEEVKKLKGRPGYENAFLVQSAEYIGVRETRRIIGEYMVTEEDAVKDKRFEDVIAISSNPVPRYYGKRFFFEHEGFDIPYRSLVPKKIENLLLAGRCISCEQVPFQSARSMAPLMAISEAAGTAAGLAVKQGVTPRQLDVKLLQKVLLENNNELRLNPNKAEEE
ncbi:FAD-dependent oxidoreductase [Candidatus Poribacteria bacterium]